MASTTTLQRVMPRWKTNVAWTLCLLLAALFAFAGLSKLSGQPMMVFEFEQIGIGQWFRYVTGAIEVIGAVALLVRRWSWQGALLLLIVDAGAFVAQVTILHMDWTHTVIIAALLGFVIWLRPQYLPQTL